MKKKKSKKKTN